MWQKGKEDSGPLKVASGAAVNKQVAGGSSKGGDGGGSKRRAAKQQAAADALQKRAEAAAKAKAEGAAAALVVAVTASATALAETRRVGAAGPAATGNAGASVTAQHLVPSVTPTTAPRVK